MSVAEKIVEYICKRKRATFAEIRAELGVGDAEITRAIEERNREAGFTKIEVYEENGEKACRWLDFEECVNRLFPQHPQSSTSTPTTPAPDRCQDATQITIPHATLTGAEKLRAVIEALMDGTKTSSELKKWGQIPTLFSKFSELYEILKALEKWGIVHSFKKGHKTYYELKKPISDDSLKTVVAALARVSGGNVVEVEGEKVLSTKTVEVPAEVRIYFKKRGREPVEGVLSEELQALFAIYGELPVEAFGVMRNEVRKFEVLQTAVWNISRLNPTNALVVYSGEALLPGDVVKGVVEEVPLMPIYRGAVRSVKVRFLRDYEVFSEKTESKVEKEESEEIDLEKAVRGVAPGHFGDDDVKRLILDALCYYEREKHEDTLVPFILVARSGGGKTNFAKGLARSFQADIRGTDAITRNFVTITPEGEVRGANFALVTVFDELDKWNKEHLDALLQIFGAEKQKRTRRGADFPMLHRTFAIGTLLENWEELITERGARGRKQTLWQLVRRSICLKLGGDEKEKRSIREKFLRYVLNKMLRHDDSSAEFPSDDEEFECIVETARVIKRAKSLKSSLTCEDADALIRL
ncbi:MAG: hypothetical protein ACXQT6_05025, partial [Candidatus Methanospirareceae archaeon]